ncbi:MAG TPA: efflux RND transporter periplasmic adaptor subunit [Anaerovoracaceae bacterium]|nr:efflux RND transporter periplasmic adaptor subunit [Anaerovoracaceae bacterium]
MKKKLNKKLVLAAGVLIVLAVFAGWSLSNQGTEAETAVAARGDIHRYVEDIGEVTCEDSITVYLEGSGLIRNIAVDEGQEVKKGDLLLSMDQAQHEIALKNAQESLREAAARSSAGEQAYRTALQDYNNTKLLAGEGAVSQWELTQKETALKSAEAVRSGYLAVLEQAELNVQDSSLALGKQQVLAPIDGVVLERNIELNEPGAPGTAAFVIGNPANVAIESKILADDASEISIGDKAEIITRTDDQQVIGGTVTKIAPTATDEISSLGVKQKKVTVTIRPLDTVASYMAESIKLGSEVDVKVITDTRAGVIVVPAGAVFDYQGDSCVFTVEGGKATLRTVTRGIGNDSFTEIIGGLKEGEVVLSAPDNSIEEGMRIKPVNR